MTGRGCIITIGSITTEGTELPLDFVRVRLTANIATEEPSVKVLLKIVGEGEGGPATSEYVVAGVVSKDSPAVFTEVALDADVFSAVRRWRVTGVVCYGVDHNRCSCTPSDTFTPLPAPAAC